MAIQHQTDPDILKSYNACLQPYNLNDPKYFWRCMLAFIPFPGWCILHSQIFKKMSITKDPIEKPWPVKLGNFLCRPGIAGTWSCCFGLAHNRKYLRRHMKWFQKYCLDAFVYLCCGFFVITRDLDLAFRGNPRAGNPDKENFKYTFWGWASKDTINQCDTCIACFLGLLFPVPFLCVIQGCAAAKIQSKDLNYALKGTLIALFGCCLGFAYNREVIREKENLKQNIGYDCLWYLAGCYFCMTMQEFYQTRKSAEVIQDANINAAPVPKRGISSEVVIS